MGLVKKTTFTQKSIKGSYWEILAINNLIGKHTEVVLGLYKDKTAWETNPEAFLQTVAVTLKPNDELVTALLEDSYDKLKESSVVEGKEQNFFAKTKKA